MQLSYWEAQSFFYHRHLIICGAGFTGLSAAIYYRRKFPERKVLILEKSPINGGASTKNAGFACFGSPSEILADLSVASEEAVFGLVEKRWRGLRNLRQLLGDEAIGYDHCHGYELFLEDGLFYTKCLDGLDYLNRCLEPIIGKKVYWAADQKIAATGLAGVAHMLENTAEGTVNTGRLYGSLLALAQEEGVEIYNGIQILGFEETGHGVQFETSAGTVSADQFLVANNGFAATLLPYSRTVPARAQVLITEPIEGLPLRGAFHMDEGYYYFRTIDNRVLLGGARNLDFQTETTTELALNDQIQARLEEVLRTMILPGQEVRVARRWTGIMGMGPEKGAIVEKLSERTFCAVRLGGMGIALSTLLGLEVVGLME